MPSATIVEVDGPDGFLCLRVGEVLYVNGNYIARREVKEYEESVCVHQG